MLIREPAAMLPVFPFFEGLQLSNKIKNWNKALMCITPIIFKYFNYGIIANAKDACFRRLSISPWHYRS